MVGIPFHADVLVTSVAAMENTLFLSRQIGVVGQFSDLWFLRLVFWGQWYEVRVMGWW